MTDYTKGPWEWEENSLYGKDDGYTVVIFDDADFPEENELSRENRALIAAAPDMLLNLKATEVALRMVTASGLLKHSNEVLIPLLESVRDAIAKAEGRSK